MEDSDNVEVVPTPLETGSYVHDVLERFFVDLQDEAEDGIDLTAFDRDELATVKDGRHSFVPLILDWGPVHAARIGFVPEVNGCPRLGGCRPKSNRGTGYSELDSSDYNI